MAPEPIAVKIIRGSNIPLVAASHEDPLTPGVLKQVLLDSLSLPHGKVQMVNWATLPVGSSFNRHYHEDMHEVFILVKGAAEMEIDGSKFQLLEKDLILVPAGLVHQMKNTAAEQCEYIVFGITEGRGGKTVTL